MNNLIRNFGEPDVPPGHDGWTPGGEDRVMLQWSGTEA